MKNKIQASGKINKFKFSYDFKLFGIIVNDKSIYLYNYQNGKIVSYYTSKFQIIDFDFLLGRENQLIILETKFDNKMIDNAVSLVSIINTSSDNILSIKEFDDVRSVSSYMVDYFVLGHVIRGKEKPIDTIIIYDIHFNKEKSFSFPGYDFAKEITFLPQKKILGVLGFFSAMVLNKDKVIWKDENYPDLVKGAFDRQLGINETEGLTLSANGILAATSYNVLKESTREKIYIYSFLENKGLGWYIEGFSSISKISLSKNGKFIGVVGVNNNHKIIKIFSLDNESSKEIAELDNCRDVKFSNNIENEFIVVSEEDNLITYHSMSLQD